MLIKELVETEQITGTKATWALAAIGYFAKTPTRQLLHELIVSISIGNCLPFCLISNSFIIINLLSF
jgi:hypothetical protein